MPTSLSTLQRNQTFLKILIFSFVTILIWVTYSLFQSQQKTGIEPDLLQLAQPLNPNIDLTVIDQLERKRHFSQQDLQGFSIYKVIRSRTGEETITTEPIVQATARLNELFGEAQPSTVSASPVPTQTASDSGQKR